MSGNIEDKAKYALRGYDVRRGSGCSWYINGQHFISCVYDQWGANPPSKVVRVLKEQVIAAGLKPKADIPPPSALEKFEGTLYEDPKEYQTAKEDYDASDKLGIGTQPNAPVSTKKQYGDYFLVSMILGFAAFILWFIMRGN